MAAAVICECCGVTVDYKDAKHIRVYSLTSATTYNSRKTDEVSDVCSKCYETLRRLIKQGDKDK